MSPVIDPQLPIPLSFDSRLDDTTDLPAAALVRKGLLKLAERGTQLIVWGALLDHHLDVPRVVKSFTFAVPDDELEEASETLSTMNLPLTPPRPLLLRTEGDFLRVGRMHRVTKSTTPSAMQCLHLIPASFPAYTPEELQPCEIDGVPFHVPRTSAVYAGIIRLMRRYRRHGPERRRLESDLELLVNYNLLQIDKVPTDEDDFATFDLDHRVSNAEEMIRSWGRCGEWRHDEEWVEDMLVAIVKGERSIGDLPCRND